MEAYTIPIPYVHPFPRTTILAYSEGTPPTWLLKAWLSFFPLLTLQIPWDPF
jgi:hypothetical protein